MGRIKTRKLKSENERGYGLDTIHHYARQRKSMALHLLPYVGDSMEERIELLDMKDNN